MSSNPAPHARLPGLTNILTQSVLIGMPDRILPQVSAVLTLSRTTRTRGDGHRPRRAAARPEPLSTSRAAASGVRPARTAEVRTYRSWRSGAGIQPRPPRPGRCTSAVPAWLPPGPATFGPVTITTNRNPRDGQPGAGCRVSAGPHPVIAGVVLDLG